ncbi:MAG: ABC transporter permease [Phycisphaerae bacterium]
MSKMATHLTRSMAVMQRELRGSSRRVRFFLLRSGYVALLAIFVGSIWQEVFADLPRADDGLDVVRIFMSDAGQRIVAGITRFQFWTAQFIAIVLMGTSVKSELDDHMLLPLLSTPLSSGNVIIGKFLGRLGHLLLLLAISLPMLAVVRSFGGIPWEFVSGSVAVTICACMFSGAVVLLLTCRSRSVVAGVLHLAVLYAIILPMLGGAVGIASSLLDLGDWSPMSYVHPMVAIARLADDLRNPGGQPFHWQLHCLWLLLLTGLSLYRASRDLHRRIFTRVLQYGSLIAPLHRYTDTQVGEALSRLAGDAPDTHADGAAGPRSLYPDVKPAPDEPTWVGPRNPLLWRDTRNRNLLRKPVVLGTLCFLLAVIAQAYLISIGSGGLMHGETQGFYLSALVLLSLMVGGLLSCMAIAPERRRQTWRLLLTLPLSDWQLLLRKLHWVFYWARWPMLAVVLHLVAFVITGVLNPLALGHFALILVGSMLFVTGLGTLSSSRNTRLAPAVMVPIVSCLVLWVVLPHGLGVVSSFSPELRERRVWQTMRSISPVEQAWLAGEANVEPPQKARFHGSPAPRRADPESQSHLSFTLLLALTSVIYSGAGAAMLLLAKRNFRRMVL